MYIIVDLVLILILLLCVLNGYRRGLAGCIIKIVSFFIAAIIAVILFKPASLIIINNTQIDENIQTSIVEIFEKESDEKTQNEENENSSPILQYISEEIENATADKKKEIVNETAKKISVNIINVLSFIIVFVLARFVLIFVKALSDLITKLPLIKQCDKIGGVLYGIIQALVIIFIGLALITFISTIIGQNALLDLINQSYIGSKLCSNNILLQLIF